MRLRRSHYGREGSAKRLCAHAAEGAPPMHDAVTFAPRRSGQLYRSSTMNARRIYSAALAAVALAACADDSLAPTQARQPLEQAAPELISEGEGIFQRYVAIGTS